MDPSDFFLLFTDFTQNLTVILIIALALPIYSVAQFGLAYILGHSVITLPWRQLLAPEDTDEHGVFWMFRTWAITLLECPACFGTWAGAFAGFGISLRYGGHPLVVVPIVALYTCGSNYLLARKAGIV